MADIKALFAEVLDNDWGTIGPKSIEAAKVLSEKLDIKHALMLHSAAASVETVLRSLEILYSDEVITASYSDPIVPMAVATVGAVPAFADIETNKALSVSSVERKLTSKTKAIVADASAELDICALLKLADSKNIKLIINLGSYADFRPEYKAAYASIIAFPCGGAIVTDTDKAFDLACAYHNCGRPMSKECTLKFDAILGGDMRITEFQSVVIMDILANEREYKANKKQLMHRAEAFKSEYFKKITGFDGEYSDIGLENSIKAMEV